MKAITVKAPWGSLIAFGHKMIEVRSQDIFRSLVGQRIAIHQGMTWDPCAIRCGFFSSNRSDMLVSEMLMPAIQHSRNYRGNIVATVRVIDCERFYALPGHVLDEARRFAPTAKISDYRYYLMDVHRLPEPIPAKGHQGIWNFDGEIE